MKLISFLALAGAALFLLPVVATAQANASVEAVPCPLALRWEGEEEGNTFDCSAVVVPENHEEPGDRTVELIVMRLKATTLSPMPDPLVYLSGGPGASALHEVTSNKILYDNLQQIRARRDVLFYDQRGTGHSQLLTCGPFFAAAGVVGELYPQVDIATLEAALETAPSAFTLITCAAGLQAAGVDLSQYNSVASAHDIAAIVAALGYRDEYNLYGTSYGTRLALNAMRSTPDNIRSVVLDGTVTPDTPNNAWTVAKMQEHYDGVFAECDRNAFCSSNFPDLRNRFIAVLSDLNDDPLVLDPPLVPFTMLRPFVGGTIDQIDPAFFAIFGKLNNDMLRGGYSIFLPQLVAALEARNEEDVRVILGSAAAQPLPEAQPVATAENALEADDAFIAPALDLLLALATRQDGNGEQTLSDELVDLVVGDLFARLEGGESQATVIKSLVEFGSIPLGGTNREALSQYVVNHVSPERSDTAAAFIAAMSRQEVRDTMWAIQDVAEVMSGYGERSGVGIAMGQMFAVNCAEDIALVPEQVSINYRDASPYPGLIVQSVQTYSRYRTACQFFPAPFSAEEMMSPVVSDIPALIFQSALDTQTPLSLGRGERASHGVAQRRPCDCGPQRRRLRRGHRRVLY